MFDMLNASQYAALHNEMRSNAGLSLNPLFADPESLGAGTDWLSPLFRTAPMHKVNLFWAVIPRLIMRHRWVIMHKTVL